MGLIVLFLNLKTYSPFHQVNNVSVQDLFGLYTVKKKKKEKSVSNSSLHVTCLNFRPSLEKQS